MKNFFEKSKDKLFNVKELPADTLLYRVMPKLVMEMLRKYVRLEVEGIENVPKRGRALIAPNHSGFAGMDAFIIGWEIFNSTKRIPRVMTHHLWFVTPQTAIPAQKLGFFEATTANATKFLKKNNLVVLFPEGEQGNFKPTAKKYQLQEFKRGFVRIALQTQSPIVPAIVIGAEETHINLRRLRFTKFLRGVVLPLPLNVIPLPVKWKVIFLEPIMLPYKPEAANNSELVHEITSEIREKIQVAINKELDRRNFIFSEKTF